MGKILKIYTINDYIIFKYNCPEGIMYHGYISGKDISCSYDTLDQILIGLICHKYDGDNTQADKLIANMLKMN